jgi:hypothetical protein
MKFRVCGFDRKNFDLGLEIHGRGTTWKGSSLVPKCVSHYVLLVSVDEDGTVSSTGPCRQGGTLPQISTWVEDQLAWRMVFE